MKDDQQVPTAGRDWLEAHFIAKIDRRIDQINQLPIRRGDRVLDIGCGTGTYTDMFFSRVGESGYVAGVDQNQELIDFALARASNRLLKPEYWCADCEKVVLSEKYGNAFEVCTMFNMLSYIDDPAVVIANAAKVVRDGGYLILKDSDFSHICLQPIDETLLASVLSAAQKDKSSEFNNFFGRRIPYLAASTLGDNWKITVDVWSFPFIPPLSPSEERYISGNLRFLGQQASGYLDGNSIEQWDQLLTPDNKNYVMKSKDFFFIMHEIVVLCRKR